MARHRRDGRAGDARHHAAARRLSGDRHARLRRGGAHRRRERDLADPRHRRHLRHSAAAEVDARLRTSTSPIWSSASWCSRIVLFVLERVRASPFGRVLRAIREDAQVAAFAGKDVLQFKVKAFAIGGAVAGLAGALYAHYSSYIVPEIYVPLLTIYIFLALTAGGIGNNFGAVIGAFVVVFFLEFDALPGRRRSVALRRAARGAARIPRRARAAAGAVLPPARADAGAAGEAGSLARDHLGHSRRSAPTGRTRPGARVTFGTASTFSSRLRRSRRAGSYRRVPNSLDRKRLVGPGPPWHADADGFERLITVVSELKVYPRRDGDRHAGEYIHNLPFTFAATKAAPHPTSSAYEVPNLLDRLVSNRFRYMTRTQCEVRHAASRHLRQQPDFRSIRRYRVVLRTKHFGHEVLHLHLPRCGRRKHFACRAAQRVFGERPAHAFSVANRYPAPIKSALSPESALVARTPERRLRARFLALDRLHDHPLRLRGIAPAEHLDPLAGLEILVVLEEVLRSAAA